MTIGEQIKLFRTSVNLSINEFGIRAKVSPQTIFNWENGVTLPDPHKLAAVEKRYNVQFDTVRLEYDALN